jgi:surface antigen
MDDPIPETHNIKKAHLIIPVIVAVFTLSACQNGPGGKELFGALGGAAVGGLLGSQIGSGAGQLAATAGGTLLGAMVGSSIGRSLDDVDQMKAEQANAQAQSVPIGETISWNNPDSGHSGTVTPTRDGYTNNGELLPGISADHYYRWKVERAHGIACRQPDGSWRVGA